MECEGNRERRDGREKERERLILDWERVIFITNVERQRHRQTEKQTTKKKWHIRKRERGLQKVHNCLMFNVLN